MRLNRAASGAIEYRLRRAVLAAGSRLPAQLLCLAATVHRVGEVAEIAIGNGQILISLGLLQRAFHALVGAFGTVVEERTLKTIQDFNDPRRNGAGSSQRYSAPSSSCSSPLAAG